MNIEIELERWAWPIGGLLITLGGWITYAKTAIRRLSQLEDRVGQIEKARDEAWLGLAKRLDTMKDEIKQSITDAIYPPGGEMPRFLLRNEFATAQNKCQSEMLGKVAELTAMVRSGEDKRDKAREVDSIRWDEITRQITRLQTLYEARHADE